MMSDELPLAPEPENPRRTVAPVDPSRLIEAARALTPARVLVGRAGTSYRTATQLEIYADHAVAADAVRQELDLARDLGREFVDRWGLFEVSTRVHDRSEYLRRPDLGRVQAGACADLVIYDGNPLEDPQLLWDPSSGRRTVVRGGRVCADTGDAPRTDH